MSTVITVENIGKKYTLHHQQREQYTALRDVIASGVRNFSKKIFSPFTPHTLPVPTVEDFWALKDVSFEVKQGDRIGIIGRNGAGKSTLLKILSRITEPTTGSVRIKGRVASLLEVGTGFHPELTGRENIFLNGAILGMGRAEIKKKFDEIVVFAEIEKFLDTPVKRYSSGMYVRLAFAVAAHLEPEILIVDEVLAVGDSQFQKKCLGKMEDVSAREGRTVLFVSHNMAAISALCPLGMYLDNGRVSVLGSMSDCTKAYLDTGEIALHTHVSDPGLPIQILSVSVGNDIGLSVRLPHNRKFYIEAYLQINTALSNVYLAVHIHDESLQTVIFSRDFESNTAFLEQRNPGVSRVRIEVPASLLVPGLYRVTLHVAQTMPPDMITGYEQGCPFEIYDAGSVRATMGYKWYGKIAADLNWSYSYESDVNNG
jgi:lipopolysaccharide transport system ATP-binding protein